MGTQRHDQIRFVAAGQAVGGGAGGKQAMVEAGVPNGQSLQELLVQPDQAIAAVQIGKGEAKAETLEDTHLGDTTFQDRANSGKTAVRMPQAPGSGNRRVIGPRASR